MNFIFKPFLVLFLLSNILYAAETNGGDNFSNDNGSSNNDDSSSNDNSSNDDDSSSNDLIIDDDSRTKNVKIEEDKEYDNVDINNGSGTDDSYSGTGSDGVNITVKDNFKLVSTADDSSAFIKVQNGGSLITQDINLSEQTYIYGDEASVTINGIARLDNNSSINTTNDTITIKKIILNDTSSIGAYKNSKVNIENITMNNSTHIYSEELDINISKNIVASGDSYVYADNNGNIIADKVILEDNASIGSSDGDVSLGDVEISGDGFVYTEKEGSSLTVQKATLKDNGFLYSKGSLLVNTDSILEGSSYIAGVENVTADTVILKDKASIGSSDGDVSLGDVEISGDGFVYTEKEGSSLTVQKATLKDNGFFYSKGSLLVNTDTILEGSSYIAGVESVIADTVILKDKANIGSSDGDVSLGDVEISGDGFVYTEKEGTSLTVQKATLKDNGFFYSKGSLLVNTDTILEGSSYIAGVESVIADKVILKDKANIGSSDGDVSLGDVEISGDGFVYTEKEGTSLTVQKATLKDNGFLYSKGSLLVETDATLEGNSYIFTDSGDLKIEGNYNAKDSAILKISNGNMVIQNNLFLNDNANIIGDGKGKISMFREASFMGKNAGIFISGINSELDINSSTINLTDGAYIVSEGRSKIDINQLNITDSGFISTNQDINIENIALVDNGNFDYILIDAKDEYLNYKTLALPNQGNINIYIVEKSDHNISVYKTIADANYFGFGNDDKNRDMYTSLAWSIHSKKDEDLYQILNFDLKVDEIYNVIQNMAPLVSISSITATDLLNASSNILDGHLYEQRIAKEKDNSYFWTKPYIVSSEHLSVNNIYGYKSSNLGIVIGLDKNINTQTKYGAGILLGSGHIESKNEAVNAETTVFSTQLFLYLLKHSESSYIEAYLLKGINKNSGTRDIPLGDVKRTATAEYDTSFTNLTFSVGTNYEFGNFMVTPYSKLSTSIISTDVYTEKGAGNLNLRVSNKDMVKNNISLGLKLSQNINLKSGSELNFEVAVSYKKDFGDRTSNAISHFRDSELSFSTEGLEIDNSFQSYSTGLLYKARNKKLEFGLNIGHETAQNFNSTKATVTTRFKF